ncbi:MAG TPA: hypothetical protein VIO59_11565 [Rhodanobacter sp.]
MMFSLRQLARSRRFRAMGVLAWLMLVVNSLAAAPPQMAGMPQAHAMTAPMAAVGTHPDQVGSMTTAAFTGADPVDCCGQLVAHHGACAAICITALTPAAAVALTPVASTAAYAMPRRISPPSLVTAPPLRPPLA